jgi:signal transduction histidine kinase/ligand-binding sensor domain-containing protein
MRQFCSRKTVPIHKRPLWLCLFFFCAFFNWQEAKAQYRFDSWNSESGLPQNSVNAILQTRESYLWLATFDGLVRYDGARFVVFNKANSRGIKSNRFTALFESGDGTLWLGTEDSGITRYREGEFEIIPTGDGVAIPPIWAFREDAKLGLMALTSQGMMRWNGERFAPYVSEDGVSLRGAKVNSQFAYFDESSLHVFDGGRFYTQTITDSKIISLTKDQRGAFWFLTDDGKANRFENGNLMSFPIEKIPEKIPNVKLYAGHQDRNGNLWLGWDDGRLSVRRNGEWKTFEVARSQIKSIYEDREGTIWLATDSDGLFRARQQAITVLAEAEGIVGENVYPILEDLEGAVWLGVWGGGLFRFKDGNLTRYTEQHGLGGSIITALYQDRAGTIMLGGINIYRFENDYLTIQTDAKTLGIGNIFVITEDRAGSLWVGGQKGLCKFSNGELQRFSTAEGLPHQTVQVITEDREGNLWLGTLGGLAVLRNDGKIQSFTEREGLASNHIRAIYIDSDGVLWIGTYDGGISRFENGKFTNYTTENGLYNNGVFQILEDARGNFWISSNLGIYRVSRRELSEFAAGQKNFITSVSYGKADGLLSLEANGGKQPAGVKTRDGRLWFPTQRGVAVINPNEISYNPLPPPVVIENCLLEREQTKCRENLQISPGRENLEIHYTGLSFIKPEQMRFKYKLEGLEEDWVEAGTRRAAYYSYLPPGDYVFRVIAANSDGVWNETGAQLKIRVLPPLWRTWWFISLMIVGTIGLAAFFYRRRILQLQRAHAARELFALQLIDSQERERKRIAAELHDSLGQNLLIIKNRALLALHTKNGTENQLNEISEMTSQAIDEVREISYNLRPYQLDRLGLTSAVEALAEKVAAASGINFKIEIDNVDDLFEKETEINFYRIVQECLNNIIKHSLATEAKIRVKREGSSVWLIIEDNGRGFTVETTPEESKKRGFGLTGIAERVRILGGTHSIQSSPGEGTAVKIRLDLPVITKNEN